MRLLSPGLEKGRTHRDRLVARIHPLAGSGVQDEELLRSGEGFGDAFFFLWRDPTDSGRDAFVNLRQMTCVDASYLSRTRGLAGLSGPARIALRHWPRLNSSPTMLLVWGQASGSWRRANRGRDRPIAPGSARTVGKPGRPVRLGESPNSYQGRRRASPHQQGRARLENPGAGSVP